MRICLYAGPGAGKSTTATHLFALLKRDGYNIELVTEYIKEWTYINRKPEGFDQVFTFGNQIHREDLVIRGGFDHLVTDSPLILSCYYAKFYKASCHRHLLEIAKDFNKQHRALNIFLERGDKAYNPVGRYQDVNTAKKIDGEMKDFLTKNNVKFHEMQTKDIEGIYKLAVRYIKFSTKKLSD